MGNIILLQDIYPFQLPNMPSDEKEILFHNLKKSDQFWTRLKRPNMKRITPSERISFIEEEQRRLEEGVWMFLKGEPVYLTAGHYDFLQYNDFPDFDGPPKYYDAQRYDFYFQQFVHDDPECFGELVIKPRRYGYTAIAISRAIHAAMKGFGQHVGMMSTDLDKVKETIFRPLVDSYLTRPKYARADIYTPNGKPPQKEMRFMKNVLDEEDEDDEGMISEHQGLKSWISPRSSTSKAFDGHKWHFVIKDEIYKWTKCRLYNTWNITKEALQVGGRIVGKAALFATMGDDDTYDEAINDGIKLWHESNYEKRNKFGRTQSGLYRYFIPAYVAFEKYIDKYGVCNQEQAKEFLEEERKEKAFTYGEDSKEYLYHIRKYPFTAEEAMANAKSSSIFSRIRIQSQINTINILSEQQPLYKTGFFELSKTGHGATFVPSREGVWKIRHWPHRDAINRVRQKNGKYILPINPEFVIGNDPVRTADNTSDHLSKNAALIYQKFDYYNTGNANKFAGCLFGRDEEVDFYNEQIRLCSLFFACPVATERQITSTFDWFKLRKMVEFLLKDDQGARGVFTIGKVINDGIEMIQAYIKKVKDDEQDWLLEIFFQELLEQLRDFEKQKSSKFDLVMSMIITFWGAERLKYTPVNNERIKKARAAVSAFVPRRN